MVRFRYIALFLTVITLFACKKDDPAVSIIPNKPKPNDTIQVQDGYLNNLAPELFDGVPISDIYEVSVKVGDKTEQVVVFQNACPSYQAGYMDMTENDAFPLDIFKNRTINWVNFSLEMPIEVVVKVLSSKVPVGSLTKVLPSRHNVSATTEGKEVKFTLSKPGQYSLEIGGEGYKNGLMIFANPKETDVPNFTASNGIVLKNATKASIAAVPTSVNSLFFDVGVHDIGVYNVPSHIKNIYLKEGAWVYGSLIMDGKPDVKIYGRGVLSSGRLKYRESHSIEAKSGSDRIRLEGIVVADSKYFAVRLIGKNNVVDWVKVIGGWTYNCDGIAAYAGSRVSNCFIWANDDAVKIYRDDIEWSDCVVWQLNNGGVIQMSWGGSNATNVKVSRLDVLRAEWNKPGFNRGLINCVGNSYQTPGQVGLQKNWLIEDVVTENAVPIVFNITPDNFTQNQIQGLIMKNWDVKMTMNTNFVNQIIGKLPTGSTIQPEDYFTGFVFENVVFNGVKLTESNWLSITKTEVENLTSPVFK